MQEALLIFKDLFLERSYALCFLSAFIRQISVMPIPSAKVGVLFILENSKIVCL
jgi:hypothetical protein